MLYLCVLALGVLSSFVLSTAGLFVLVSILVVGVGVSGAISHRPLLPTLLEAGAVSITIQLAYGLPLLWALVWPLSSRRSQRESTSPAAIAGRPLTDDSSVVEASTQPTMSTAAPAHIRAMVKRTGDRRPRVATNSKVRAVLANPRET